MTDAEPQIHPGEILAGKYRVERLLGVGGMGVVVSAMHLELEHRVAVKLVHKSAQASETSRQRLLREARAAAKLRSEHAARVIDVGQDAEGTPYIVMEYLDGVDLAQLVRDEGPLAVDIAVDYVAQACEAIAEAHALGIVHRDLKPQNLFLTKKLNGAPHVKVLDFGISKLEGASLEAGLTQTSVVMGSPLYMAPEQMRSARTADARSDVWSLGVVLFELLTRTTPYVADTITELAIAVTTDPPTKLDSVRADVPPELVAVVDRCLEKDPAKRYQNAAELAAALHPLCSSTGRAAATAAMSVHEHVRRTSPIASTPPAGPSPLPRTPEEARSPLASARTHPSTPPPASSSPAVTSQTPESRPSRETQRSWNADPRATSRGGSRRILFGVAGVVAVGAILFAAFGRGSHPASEPAAHGETKAEPHASAPTVPTPVAAGITPDVAPVASEAAAPSPEPPSPPSASPPPTASAPTRSAPTPKTAPKPVAKPRHTDDDIPSVR